MIYPMPVNQDLKKALKASRVQYERNQLRKYKTKADNMKKASHFVKMAINLSKKEAAIWNFDAQQLAHAIYHSAWQYCRTSMTLH